MIGIFIIARLGSTRLSQKHLIEVKGKTLIEWLVSRYTAAFNQELLSSRAGIFIVTSEKLENKKFEQLFSANPYVRVFYGADANIPLRQLQCAEAHAINEIISIDGDDILCSTQAAMVVADRLLHGADYVKTVGLPLGMNVMGYKANLLKKALNTHTQSTLETGWGRIFNEEKTSQVELGIYASDERLRLTLDYPEDASFFKKVIDSYPYDILSVEDSALIKFILDNEFYKLNQSASDKYWKNFDLLKQNES